MKADGFDAAARRGVGAAAGLAWVAALFPLLPVFAALITVRLAPGNIPAISAALAGSAAALAGALIGRAAVRKVARAFAEAAALSSPALKLPDARDLLIGLRELAGQASSVLEKENGDLHRRLALSAGAAEEAQRLVELLSEKLAALAALCKGNGESEPEAEIGEKNLPELTMNEG